MSDYNKFNDIPAWVVFQTLDEPEVKNAGDPDTVSTLQSYLGAALGDLSSFSPEKTGSSFGANEQVDASRKLIIDLKVAFADDSEDGLNSFYSRLSSPSVSNDSPVFNFLFDCIIGKLADDYGTDIKIQILSLLTVVLPMDSRLRDAQIECMHSENSDLKKMAIFLFGSLPEEKGFCKEDIDVLLELIEIEAITDIRFDIVLALLRLNYKRAPSLLTENEMLWALNLFFKRNKDFQAEIMTIIGYASELTPSVLEHLFDLALSDDLDESFRSFLYLKIIQLSENLSFEDLDELIKRIPADDKQDFVLNLPSSLNPDLRTAFFRNVCDKCTGSISEQFDEKIKEGSVFPTGSLIDSFNLEEYSVYDFFLANIQLAKLTLLDSELDENEIENFILMIIRGIAIKPFMTIEGLRVFWETSYEIMLSRLNDQTDTDLMLFEVYGNSLYEDPDFHKETLDRANLLFNISAEVLSLLSEEHYVLVMNKIEMEINSGIYNFIQLDSLNRLKKLLNRSIS